jgi:hypothetical protein
VSREGEISVIAEGSPASMIINPCRTHPAWRAGAAGNRFVTTASMP